MSAEPYSRMTTDALIEEFIRVAKTMRSPWTLLPDFPQPSPERPARMKELAAIGAELKLRKPIQKLRSLFDNENNDVRAFAATRFREIDEDWELATLSELGAGISTSEFLALYARSKRRPPSRPALKDMSVAQLAARFEDAGMRRYATQ